ncbi:MAG: BamA/TamA family outer membrane protein [Ferruginibacter sp.]
MRFSFPKNIIYFLLLLSSCTIIRKAPQNKPYLVKNTIVVSGGNFSKTERQAVVQRLFNQLDDSSKVNTKTSFFVLTTLKRPVAYDTGYSSVSALNMRSSMYHLGYYNAKATYTQDTSGRKVSVRYLVNTGNPTLIDTLSYNLKKPELQQIALRSKKDAQLVKNNPITKVSVLAEVGRLVDSFRNNGYYKFTAAELRVRGDTTIAALTTITDDPFEQLRLLNEAQQQKDSPTIKLGIVINKPDDSAKLNKYYINKIYVLPDYRPQDILTDTVNLIQRTTDKFVLRYHRRLFRTALFSRNITLRKGEVYRQEDYYKTLSNLSKLGVWQSVNIRVIENLDEANKVDLIAELLPGKKFGFESSVEASYSATSNTNNALGGNLFGISTNFSLVNRNIGKEAIRMTHNLRAGIELNNNSRSTATGLINSSELSYSNNILIPRLLMPQGLIRRLTPKTAETFVNTSFSYNNRLNLFSLQSVNLNFGYSLTDKKNRRIIIRPLNAEFSYLFNESQKFRDLLDTTTFLRYSYNTSFILGMAAGYSSLYRNPRHPLSLLKERSLKLNLEESGLTIGAFPILNNYKKSYLKFDAEYKYTVSKLKTAFAFRAFAGVGIPLSGDTALPFFKQYYGGGSNSMRGWPVRGIGRGSQKLASFAQNIFNDRTGDIQLESNIEYRHDIARLIPDLLTLKGAVFVDIGNVWNFRKSSIATDPAKFEFKNLYKELGLSAGYGFRFDFNYLILRTDFGFRFKRPETSEINNGWKAPPIGFDDAFPKIFSKRFRQWRYENFNFTVGINYPF